MDSASSRRLFLALWPDPATRHALRARRDAWDWPRGASPVHPDKLHMTLHFLGGVPSDRVDALRTGLAVPFSPFTLSLGVPTLWPHGIAVLEPHSAPPALLRLHAGLADALVALGLQPEARTFRPHVTLARRAAAATVPPEDTPLAWHIDGYALVESQPPSGHTAGGIYTLLQEYR